MTVSILFTHEIFSQQKYGGISRYFYETANQIAGIDECEVEIFAPFYINAYFDYNSNVRPIGIKIPTVPHTGRIVRAVDNAASRLLVKRRKDLDIFHETYYSMTDCCPRSAKRVITVYDMIDEKFADICLQPVKIQQIKAHAVRRADHVICISENTRRDLIEILGIPEEKTSVVYLGSSFVTQKAAAKPVKVGKPFILYVGFRGGYKNFEGLLRAYGHSPLLKNNFAIVCFGRGGFSKGELSLAESLHISQYNLLHLYGPDDMLAGLYTSAAAFVYPSLYEGFGISPLEAMSFGCPVVSANVSSLPEVVGDAAELFDPADDAEMCAAIERVVSTPERAKILVNRGFKRAKQFSWEKCARETLNIYKNILQS